MKALSKDKFITFVKLSLASTIFCIFQVSYDYWTYTIAYEQEQQKAREELNERFQTFKANLNAFLTSAAERIAKQSHDPQHVQHVLFSLQALTKHIALPPLQRVSFKTPRKVFTRFGMHPLSTGDPALMEAPIERSQDLFLKEEGAIMIKRHPALNRGDPLGWLEVEIAAEDLITSLKPSFHIRISPSKKNLSEQQEGQLLNPLWLQNIPPQSLHGFIWQGWFQYCHFFIFCLVSCGFLTLGLYHMSQRSRKEHADYLLNLEEQTRILSKERDVLRDEKCILQNELKSLALSFTTYKALLSDRASYLKGEAQKIHMALNTLWQSYENSKLPLPEKEYLTLFTVSLKSSEILTELMPPPNEKAETWVNMKECLDQVVLLFAHKVFKGNVLLEVHCSSDLRVQVNPFLITLLLINLVGKALYRVPHHGKVQVWIVEKNESCCIQVEDNGFSVGGASEKLILKSFEWFIEENLLQKAYQEYGFLFSLQKTDTGNTQTSLTLPKTNSSMDRSNVVPLFS